MPYITRDENQNILTVNYVEQFSELFNVLSIHREGNVVTLILATPQIMETSKLTTIVVSGADEVIYLDKKRDPYNGKFVITKISDTEYSYNILLNDIPQPTGDIKVRFAIEYISEMHQDIIDVNQKVIDINSIEQKRNELINGDYKIIRHYEEICAGTTTTITQLEFETLHTNRNILRNEISFLESKFGI